MNEIRHSLRFPLRIDRHVGRMAKETDYDDYLRQLIRQVLLTSQGERIKRPTFGAGVKRMVFSPLSPGVASLAETFVYQALTQWLSTVIKVESIKAQANGERLDIGINYIVIARGEKRFLNVDIKT